MPLKASASCTIPAAASLLAVLQAASGEDNTRDHRWLNRQSSWRP